jgi:hypothetical protein
MTPDLVIFLNLEGADCVWIIYLDDIEELPSILIERGSGQEPRPLNDFSNGLLPFYGHDMKALDALHFPEPLNGLNTDLVLLTPSILLMTSSGISIPETLFLM